MHTHTYAHMQTRIQRYRKYQLEKYTGTQYHIDACAYCDFCWVCVRARVCVCECACGVCEHVCVSVIHTNTKHTTFEFVQIAFAQLRKDMRCVSKWVGSHECVWAEEGEFFPSYSSSMYVCELSNTFGSQ